MSWRLGLTIPLDGPLATQGGTLAALAVAGYTDLWSAETARADAFAPLLLAAGSAPTVRLGTAVASAFGRGPGLFAMQASALANAVPGRAVIGIGASSQAIVEGWNDRQYHRPLSRVLDTVRFLRSALAGERVTEQYDTFAVRGFQLECPPAVVPPIFVAALRERMLAAAGAEADGAEVVARVFVCPSTDVETVRREGRKFLARYLTVPVYADYHRWLGRADMLDGLWSAWADRRRDDAAAAVPDEIVDELIVHGSPSDCADHLRRYVAAGANSVVVKVLPLETGLDTAVAATSIAEAVCTLCR
jgi:alkanesulfonate monooxygenase SsuD/methylene tetrahydromethanopterin reductase-like flavin-dependent oxidoreductase (luciferase family)